MEGKSRTYLKAHKIEIKGVCHNLHPHLRPQQENTGVSETQVHQVNEANANKENSQRKPAPVNRFEACPAKGAH